MRFPAKKNAGCSKVRAISRQEKMAFSSPPSGCLGTLLPLPQSLCGRTDGRTCVRTYVTITSQPKFLGSIGYQICFAMELRWRALPAGSAMNFIFEWLNIVFYHEKIKFIFSSRRVIFFFLYRQDCFCTNNNVKAGNDVNDILTSEDNGKYVTRVPDVVSYELYEWSIFYTSNSSHYSCPRFFHKFIDIDNVK